MGALEVGPQQARRVVVLGVEIAQQRAQLRQRQRSQRGTGEAPGQYIPRHLAAVVVEGHARVTGLDDRLPTGFILLVLPGSVTLLSVTDQDCQ